MSSTTAWRGVIPAITTPFTDDYSVDHDLLARHAAWLIESGCTGLVVCGSLGEGATLAYDEKLRVLETCVAAVGQDALVATAVSSLSTAEAVRFAKDAETAGAQGLMVLPPYAYSTDWTEMRAHVSTVISATGLPCMLYNNPVSYRTDYLPEQIAELASAHRNLTAVKESSTDLRRVTAIRALLGTRLSICVGVDDLAVEAAAAGADGWIAGLVNALPVESVQLFNLAAAGETKQALDLYHWFLPLLRLDTDVKLVQLIKLVQERCDMGNRRVRAPRLELEGAELDAALSVIDSALASRPDVVATQL